MNIDERFRNIIRRVFFTISIVAPPIILFLELCPLAHADGVIGVYDSCQHLQTATVTTVPAGTPVGPTGTVNNVGMVYGANSICDSALGTSSANECSARFWYTDTAGAYHNNYYCAFPNGSTSAIGSYSKYTYSTTGAASNFVKPSTNSSLNNFLVASGAAILGLATFLGVLAIYTNPMVLAGTLSTAAIAAIIAYTSTSTPTKPADTSNYSPLTVTLSPTTPLTVNGGSTPAVVRSTTTSLFAPSGGLTGSWTQNSNGYFTNIPATLTTPATSVHISADQKTVEIDSAQLGTTPPKTVVYNTDTDQSLNVTVATKLPTTSPTGQPTSVGAAVTYNFDSAGVLTGTTNAVNSTNVDGSNFNPNTNFGNPLSTTGTGSGTGTTTGTGTSSFTCSSSSQNCESTQMQIRDAITNAKGDTTAPRLSTTQTTLDSALDSTNTAVSGILQTYVTSSSSTLTGTYNSILSYSPLTYLTSSTSATCNFNFTFMGHTYTMSICMYQSMINTVVSFIFFVITLIGITSLVFERDN